MASKQKAPFFDIDAEIAALEIEVVEIKALGQTFRAKPIEDLGIDELFAAAAADSKTSEPVATLLDEESAARWLELNPPYLHNYIAFDKLWGMHSTVPTKQPED